MRVFDCHSHWATEGHSVMRTDEDWHHAQRIWKMERRTYGDEEQAEYFRKHNDYALAHQRRFPDVVFGHWLQFEPWRSTESLAEFQRCREANAGFVGFC